jgi:hypothetical protein
VSRGEDEGGSTVVWDEEPGSGTRSKLCRARLPKEESFWAI